LPHFASPKEEEGRRSGRGKKERREREGRGGKEGRFAWI